MDPNSYQNEQKRVDSIVQQIEDKIKLTKFEYDQAHNETRNVLKNFNSNTSVNFFEKDDRMETNAEIQQQRSVISRDMENESVVKHRLKKFHALKESPYFGRIDIQDPKTKEQKRLYIGTASLMSESNDKFLVFDWRAPIASVYYNGTLGTVSYDTPAGEQTTDLKKKRQYSIKNGKIDNMFDTNETVGDEMLQNALGSKNDSKMHNIVATIQHEQNDIIRDTTSDLLVVQGVAGSGKTSAILQRIAFLLYHSRSSLDVNQIVLFSPNRLFSHYISDVLPSLGENNMRQVTLADFLSRRLEGLNVQTIFNRYENDAELSNEELNIRQFKGTAHFMKSLKQYCLNLSVDQLAFTSIYFNGRPFFGAETIKLIYASLPERMTLSDKLLNVKNQLIIMLKNRISDEAKKPWVEKEVDQLSDENLHDLYLKDELREKNSAEDERYYIAKIIAKNRLRQVYNAIYNDDFFDPYIQYQRFLSQLSLPDNIASGDWSQSIQEFKRQIEAHRLSLDDAAPLLYLRDLITGSGRNHSIQYLFVDEMQDYSIAQLIYFKHAFPKAKLNLIGDSEQALFKEVEEPQALLNKLNNAFTSKRSRLIKLNRAYRSTYPITNFAKELLPNGKYIQPFNRQGPLPHIIIRYDNESGLKSLIEESKKQLTTNDTVAILTKDLKEAKYLYQKIHSDLDAKLMSDVDRSLPKGIIILPIYLAKGLEFDSVIAWDVSQNNYNQKRLLGTLYTISTRAMHDLTMISIGSVSPLITDSDIKQNQFTLDRQVKTIK